MKRISLFLCLIAVFALFFSACTSAGDYQVLVFDSSDSIGESATSDKYSYWSDNNIDVSGVASVFSVEIDGNQHTGTYQRAHMIVPNTYPVYTYSDENNDVFSVDPNGLLTSYFWGEPESPQGEQSKLSEEACLEIAKQFLDDLVDVDLYAIDTEYESDQGRYNFTFTKYIDNQKTADMASISVLEAGELYSYSSSMLGKIPTDTQLDFDCDKATKAVYKKLDALYADVREKYDKIEYQVASQRITILENGNVALLCYVDTGRCIIVRHSSANHRNKSIQIYVRRSYQISVRF